MADTTEEVFDHDETTMIQLQDLWVESGKDNILKDGHLRPVAFVMTKMDSVDPLKGIFGVIELERNMQKGPNGLSVIILDLIFSWSSRYAILMAAKEIPEKVKTVTKLLLDEGKKRFEEEQAYLHVTRALMTAGKLHEKDVQALAIKTVCRKMGAIGVIMMSEAWHAKDYSKDRDGYQKAGSVEAMPESVEGLMCILDTPKFKRLLITDMIREEGHPKGEGPIKGFGHVFEEIDREDDLEGRFMELLPRDENYS